MQLTSVHGCPLAWIAGTILLAATAGCDAAFTKADPERELLESMRAKYDARLAERPPDQVVITYPTTADALPELQRSELRVLSEVLAARHIPFETKPVAATLATLTRGKKDYRAFQVPDGAASGAVVLYVNLDAATLPALAAHPDAKTRGVTVRVWNDPMRVSNTRS